MAKKQIITLRPVDPVSVVYSQSKVTGVAKASLPARTSMAKIFGIRIPKKEGPARLIDYIHSFFLLANVKWSRSKRLSFIIFRMPFPIMFGYVLFLKGLEKMLLIGIPKGRGVGNTLEEELYIT